MSCHIRLVTYLRFAIFLVFPRLFVQFYYTGEPVEIAIYVTLRNHSDFGKLLLRLILFQDFLSYLLSNVPNFYNLPYQQAFLQFTCNIDSDVVSCK